jgi:hypothetical protein
VTPSALSVRSTVTASVGGRFRLSKMTSGW